MSQIRWTKAISPQKELEGGVCSTPNFIFTIFFRASGRYPKGPQQVPKGHQPEVEGHQLLTKGHQSVAEGHQPSAGARWRPP